MDLRLTPKKLCGNVTVPASKSMCHRMVIAAALSDGTSRVNGLSISEDITATLQAVAALGAEYTLNGGSVVIGKGKKPQSVPLLDCGESGSTLRFLIPAALALTGEACFTGHGRLMERPMGPYVELFGRKGIVFE